MQNFSISHWLAEIGLAEYSTAFEDNALSADLLSSLTDHDLQQIGVTKLGHRKRLLSAIASLKPAQPSAPNVQPHTVLLRTSEGQAEPTPAPLESGAERRQITVVFCDLVGSTKMANSLDPETVQQIIEAYHEASRTIIESLDGVVAQYLGDGVMAYFGWPRAHENDAERAQLSALQLVEKIPALQTQGVPLRVRVGIASGTVVIGKLSTTGKSMLAIGDTPNLASRLQSLAEPGQIMIANDSYKLTKNIFQYVDKGMHEIKGVELPLQVWQLTRAASAMSRYEGLQIQSAQYVGREADVQKLKQLWQSTQAGEGQVAVLQGEPGIGKSRTAKLLEEYIVQQPHICLHIHASPFHINSAFYPVISHLLHASGIAESDTEKEKYFKLKSMLLQHAKIDDQAVALIADLLGVRLKGSKPGAGMTPAMKKAQTIQALADMVSNIAEHSPVLIVVEDMHWLDASSVEVVEALLKLARSKHFMIVATSRSDPPPLWVVEKHVHRFHLAKLSEKEARGLIDATLGSEALPDGLINSIVDMTDGVPLFVEELTKSLMESGRDELRQPQKNTGLSKPMLTVPLTLRDSLMARLDRLPFGREVAQIASCIGREFEYRLLAKISPFKGESLDSALGLLLAAGLLSCKEIAYQDVYVFKHRMLQEVAYESLLKSLRQQLHGQIANAMADHFPEYAVNQPELLAHHFSAADLPQQATLFWQHAGELALRRMAVQEAVSHFDSALTQLQLLPPSDQRDIQELAIRTSLGTSWMALRGWATPQIPEHLNRAWQLAQAQKIDQHSLRIIWGLWVQLQCTGRIRDSLYWATLMLSEAARIGNPDMKTAGRMAACVSHYYLGEYRESLDYAESLIDAYEVASVGHMADLLNHDPKTIGGVQKAFCLWMLGQPETASATMQATVVHANQRGHAFDICYAVHCAGALAGQIGDPKEYARLVEALQHLGHKMRLPFFEQIMAGISHASVLLISHQPEQASAEFERILPRFDATGMGIAYTRYRGLSAQSHGEAGRHDVALEMLSAVLAYIERPGWEEKYYYPEVLRIKGDVYQRKGQLAEAEEFFLQAIQAARAQRALSWELRATNSLAQLLSQIDRAAESRTLLQSVLQKFDQGYAQPDLVQAKALLQRLGPATNLRAVPRASNH